MYQEVSFKTEQVIYAHTRSDEADMEYKMHCHNSYEIYYMINRECRVSSGRKILLSPSGKPFSDRTWLFSWSESAGWK